MTERRQGQWQCGDDESGQGGTSVYDDLDDLAHRFQAVRQAHEAPGPEPASAKLREETEEFLAATDPKERLAEGADVVIAVTQLLLDDGHTVSDLLNAVRGKFIANIGRTWVLREDGMIHHA